MITRAPSSTRVLECMELHRQSLVHFLTVMLNCAEEDVLGLRRSKQQVAAEKRVMMHHPKFIRIIKSRRMRLQGMWHAWSRRDTHSFGGKVWRLLGRPRCRWDDNLAVGLKWDGMTWTRFIWLTVGTSGGLLWTQWWNFRFHKIYGISFLAENLLTSEEFCYMEFFKQWCLVKPGWVTCALSLYQQPNHFCPSSVHSKT